MARITDVQRGARIALEVAAAHLVQPDLFADAIPRDFWQDIERAANDQLDDCDAERFAMRGHS